MKTGTVARVINNARSHDVAIASLYMAALNRPPTSTEYSVMKNPKMIALPRVNKPRNSKFWHEYYQDLFWALLNSNEFMLNH
jgi:hypothetical protein